MDQVTVAEFKDWLKVHWPSVKEALLDGSVFAATCPPSGNTKAWRKRGAKLGIPTVVDRLIQQAIHQVLDRYLTRGSLNPATGFAGTRGHQAVRKAASTCGQGNRWVVDLDLEKFFDRVNHDVLMSRVARRSRQTGASAHTGIPASRDGRRAGGTVAGRDTAGRTAVTPAVEHPAGRAGQGAGTTRALVLPLRG